MALRPVTVSQLNEYISRVLTTDPLLGNISVCGEISNLKFHSSGHVYFSLIDESGKVNCFLPSGYARNIHYALGDGLEVIVRGYINVYKKGGTYTLFVKDVEVSGEGNLSAAFELLKKKLSGEGLFDQAHKKPIPSFPHKIGIVTSPTGAAVRDMLKIIKSRTSMTDVFIFPALVQGPDAAKDMADKLDMINEKFAGEIDLIIIGRGGGSAEDLWAFNEECLARAVYRSNIPIISAVGHEVDFSICDFVADMRAETPTAAAEKAVPDDALLSEKLEEYKKSLSSHLKSKVNYFALASESRLKDMRLTLVNIMDRMVHILEQQMITLNENNPENILLKGYALIENSQGKIISSVNSFTDREIYKIHLRDGCLEVTVSDIKKEGEKS